MKNLVLFLILAGIITISACKSKESEKFKLLTGPTWVADSLLANGVDASGPDGVLNKFKGDAKFNTDGSGTFGEYSGDWKFNNTESEIIITSDSIPIPISAEIKELTSTSLKVTTSLITPNPPYTLLDIRMTFKAK
jgi:hypothetical protein